MNSQTFYKDIIRILIVVDIIPVLSTIVGEMTIVLTLTLVCRVRRYQSVVLFVNISTLVSTSELLKRTKRTVLNEFGSLDYHQ